MPISKEQLEDLKTKHSRIAHMRSEYTKTDGSPEWEFVMRFPKRAEYKQYRAQLHDDRRKAEAQEMLVRKLVVYPSAEEFDALLEDWPALCDGCGKQLIELAGANQVEEGKH